MRCCLQPWDLKGLWALRRGQQLPGWGAWPPPPPRPQEAESLQKHRPLVSICEYDTLGELDPRPGPGPRMGTIAPRGNPQADWKADPPTGTGILGSFGLSRCPHGTRPWQGASFLIALGFVSVSEISLDAPSPRGMCPFLPIIRPAFLLSIFRLCCEVY